MAKTVLYTHVLPMQNDVFRRMSAGWLRKEDPVPYLRNKKKYKETFSVKLVGSHLYFLFLVNVYTG